MSLFSWISGLFGHHAYPEVLDGLSSAVSSHPDPVVINPANGQMMVGGIGGLDVTGNPYGTDFSHEHLPLMGGTDHFGSTDHWDNGAASFSNDGWSS